MFHAVTSGRCVLDVEGCEAHVLQPGGFALVPHGAGHRLASESGVAAARLFDLPPDREGDVVVIGDTGTCIGAAEADHDLSGLKGHRLRTHGGVSERRVPFILNYPLRPEYAARAAAAPLRSYQIFDFAINGIDAGARSA